MQTRDSPAKTCAKRGCAEMPNFVRSNRAPSTQHHQVVSDLFPAAPLRSLVPLQSRVTKVDRYHRIKLIHAREIRCANDIRMLAR